MSARPDSKLEKHPVGAQETDCDQTLRSRKDSGTGLRFFICVADVLELS